MPLGPGKYDNICEAAMWEADAELAAVIIIGGTKGDGFSITTTSKGLAAGLPKVLRMVADEIEATMNNKETNQ